MEASDPPLPNASADAWTNPGVTIDEEKSPEPSNPPPNTNTGAGSVGRKLRAAFAEVPEHALARPTPPTDSNVEQLADKAGPEAVSARPAIKSMPATTVARILTSQIRNLVT
jgi:hypothetical protein